MVVLLRPDEQVLAFKTTSHYTAVWLYAQHYISQDTPNKKVDLGETSLLFCRFFQRLCLQEKFQQLLQLGLSEGAVISGKAQEAKEALMEVGTPRFRVKRREVRGWKMKI